jgi:protoporphyrinogen oxidase
LSKKTAIIIGAGPAGLTAAYELLTRSDVLPIIIESSEEIGGLSRTVVHNGNRLDIGGHRFFTKSERVMQWWTRVLPIERCKTELQNSVTLRYKGATALLPISAEGPDPEDEDDVMLVRERRSSILHDGSLLTYPIELSFKTFRHLGLLKSLRIGMSYILARIFPIREEKNLEDFFINRFGRSLYETFFKSYSEKVWGMPCADLSPNWGAQRVKSLSLGKTVLHAVFACCPWLQRIKKLPIETSLIEHFLYPKFGPGQMWESVAKDIVRLGGEIRYAEHVCGVSIKEERIESVVIEKQGVHDSLTADYVFSSMPLRDFFGETSSAPEDVASIGASLVYRDFLIVGLLFRRAETESVLSEIQDNWIYIQEPDVRLARIQIFNNWSPYLVNDPETLWLGLEYFCEEDDELWRSVDSDIVSFARGELQKVNLVDSSSVLDSTVVRVPKAYPSYSGSYSEVVKVQDYLNSIRNLYPLGRNGTHSYNNQDHSMLTAMEAVDSLISTTGGKSDVWNINIEKDYLERVNAEDDS